MKVLGIIPARGDSQGCPGKNLRTLGSKHIIQWTIDAWLSAGFDSGDLVISTESEDIRRSFTNSRNIALIDQGRRTDSPAAVINQVLDRHGAEIVVYLQPTTPFKKPEHIRLAVNLIAERKFSSVFTGMRIPDRFHPFNAFHMDKHGQAFCDEDYFEPKRQNLDALYSRTGDVYAFRVSEYAKYLNIYQHPCHIIETDPLDYCNIDTEEDWLEAEWRAAEIERYVDVDMLLRGAKADALDKQAAEASPRDRARIQANRASEGL